jgi:predicted TIM-barrel fold metal-dependent hydrolase
VDNADQRYVVISSDAHAGARLIDYKQYLASAFHDDFDRWAGGFRDAWGDYDTELVDTDDDGLRIGAASFMSPYNWDNDERLAHMDQDGIAAEVIFPNTIPPFFPSGVISAPAPSTAEEYRYRWAGVQAHNRWAVDFCRAGGGRRAGVAQVFLSDVDDAVAEVRWAKEAGLAGVLIPADHLGRLIDLYEPRLDPFWQVCADLGMPVHRHAIVAGYPEDDVHGLAAPVIGLYESANFSSRGLSHLVFGGVFERHPTLRFVFTESRYQWAPTELARMTGMIRKGLTKGDVLYPYSHRCFEQLSLSPSEYFQRHVSFGASGMTRGEVAMRHQIGVARIMWGADYPHHEGTWPNTPLALRVLFHDVPEDEVRMMTSVNAAEMYGFDLAALRPIADRIGPTVGQVATPVSSEEIPRPSFCETFADAAHRFDESGTLATAGARHWSQAS